MASIERTAYPRFRRLVTARELASFNTSGNDVICGFGGNDSIFFVGAFPDFSAGDIFLGGDGNDFMESVRGVMFVGGAGNDRAFVLNSGTFNGGAGDDSVRILHDGTFNGEAGCDFVESMDGPGTFNPGDQSTCTA